MLTNCEKPRTRRRSRPLKTNGGLDGTPLQAIETDFYEPTRPALRRFWRAISKVYTESKPPRLQSPKPHAQLFPILRLSLPIAPSAAFGHSPCPLKSNRRMNIAESSKLGRACVLAIGHFVLDKG
jgi:hypothetical protein